MGRRVFGRAPEVYDRHRLDYPARVFELLHRRCGLGPASRVLEIGPGTGKATRQLLAAGARSILAVEPNRRLAGYLRRHLPAGSDVEVRHVGFEEARLPPRQFDLVVAATSFHWLDERRALAKVARLLRPGGWWVAWWNHHGDPFHPSPLSRAAHRLYGEPDATWSGWQRRNQQEAVRERTRRVTRLRRVGGFDRISFEEVRWSVRLSTERVCGLWSTFSEVAQLPPRRRAAFLEGLARVMDEEFGGAVRYRVVTPIYTARRTGLRMGPPRSQ